MGVVWLILFYCFIVCFDCLCLLVLWLFAAGDCWFGCMARLSWVVLIVFSV